MNTKIRVITRMAFGFHNPAALIGLAMLALGGLRPGPPRKIIKNLPTEPAVGPQMFCEAPGSMSW